MDKKNSFGAFFCILCEEFLNHIDDRKIKN